MKKLLTLGNPKTEKSIAFGFLTAVLHLAPYKMSGFNMCPMAELAGCHVGCLNTAGRGGISKGSVKMMTPGGEVPDNVIQHARIARTQLYMNDRPEFMRRLYQEIRAFIRKAKRAGLTPAIRLNGTSDIQWERIPFPVSDNTRGVHMIYTNVFAAFPEIQFYDYTKIPKRFTRELPSNYHLTLSWSGASHKYLQAMIDVAMWGPNTVTVVRTQDQKDQALAQTSKYPLIDGDLHDLRFLDPKGSLVYLKAKGAAKRDETGFVMDYTS